MKHFMFILILMSCSNQIALSQSNLLPFLSGEKYGVVDEMGKTILPSKFDNLYIYYSNHIIVAKIDDFWNVYDFNGRKLIDHNFTAPSVRVVKNKRNSFRSNFVKPSNLIALIDKTQYDKFYVNPSAPLKKYKAYYNQSKRSRHHQSNSIFPIYNKFIAINKDKTVSIIDSTGKEIFSALEGAHLVSNEFTAIKKNGLYALFKNKEQITEYIYEKFVQLGIGEFFYSKKKRNIEENQLKDLYHIFDKNGKILLESYGWPSKKNNMLLARDLANNTHVFDSTLKRLSTIKNSYSDWLTIGNKNYLLIPRNKLYGLYNVDGSIALDTIYDRLQSHKKELLYIRGKTHGVMDSNFNIILESDTLHSLKISPQPAVYEFTVKGPKDKYHTGFIDANRKVIIPAERRLEKYSECKNFVILSRDSFSEIRRLSDGEIISSVTNGNFYVDIQSKLIVKYTKNNITKLDYNGNFVSSKIRNNTQERKALTSKYIAKKSGNFFVLADLQDNIVKNDKYKRIEIMQDGDTGKFAYFCIFSDGHPSCVVYNDDLEEIAQPGYSISRNWVTLMKPNAGRIVVANDVDIALRKSSYRIGIIDFEGNWIVPPFKGFFEFMDKDVFLLINQDLKKYQFFSKDGEINNARDYFFVAKKNGSHYRHNRIRVGYIKDKEYLHKLEQLATASELKSELDPIKFNEKFNSLRAEIKALGETKMLYGYVNTKGEEIIPPKYVRAKDFGREAYTIVGTINDSGKISSHLIDTLGNKIFSAPYEEMSRIKKGFYSCGKKNNLAIVDSTGSIKTPFKFNRISNGLRMFEPFYIAYDSIQSYIIDKTFKIHPLDLPGNLDFKRINDDYFYIKSDLFNKTTSKRTVKFALYSKEMKLIDTFENIEWISPRFSNIDLPKDYVVIIEKNKPQVVYSIKQKKLLKE